MLSTAAEHGSSAEKVEWIDNAQKAAVFQAASIRSTEKRCDWPIVWLESCVAVSRRMRVFNP